MKKVFTTYQFCGNPVDYLAEIQVKDFALERAIQILRDDEDTKLAIALLREVSAYLSAVAPAYVSVTTDSIDE